jgi:hypothetical protein
MRINVTLFVQIINFAITYLVLNRFFFKPLLNSLEKKDLAKKELEQKIDVEEKELVGLENKKSSDVGSFQLMIKQKYPYEPYLIRTAAEQTPIISEEKVDRAVLEKQIVDFLSKKVPHVD